ncbi:MAG: gliding motility protein GldN [Taibaiella sp.]|nr:gliding motility protein GldN [Taibaiella sp.]
MNVLRSYKIAASVALLFTVNAAFAQGNPNIADQSISNPNGGMVKADWQPSLVKDGVYDRIPHVSTALGWQPIREVDILWKKRVWREIDTREKQNMGFRYPGDENTGGGYFIEIMIDAIKKGKVKAYSNLDDRFTSALTKDQILDMLIGKPDTTQVEDPNTGQMKTIITRREFNPDAVTKYRIKEDWIFDRNLGKMVVRIIAIAPLLDKYNEDGSFRASQAMFWVYYPEVRETLAQYEVFNAENDVARMTWDDFFETRQFSSKIIKVSNPFDETYNQAGFSNMESLYQGQQASEKIFNKEHDMWVY